MRRQTNRTGQAMPCNPPLFLWVSAVIQARLGMLTLSNSWDGGWKGTTVWAVKDSVTSETTVVHRGGTEFAEGGWGAWLSIWVVCGV
jgi:hypothetical protein